MSGFDLLDAESGILASVDEDGAAVMFHREETLGPVPAGHADAGVDLGSGVGRMSISGNTLAFGTENSEAGVRLEGNLIGTTEIELCTATGGFMTKDGESPLRCLALSVRTAAAQAPDLALSRSIVVAFADGGLFALRAARPVKASEQEDEEVVAVFAGGGGGAPYRVGEPLLSTTYDATGSPDRATLELWPEEDSGRRLSRGAGTMLRGTTLELDDRRIDLAFFRWSVDGRQGLGRYEIVRAI